VSGEGRARGLTALALAVLVLAGAAPTGAPAGVFERGRHGERPYRLWVPGAARSEPATRRPLVVALHGCWQTPEDFALGTRLNEAAERRGLLVLYPAQTRRHNASRCWNWFEPPESPASETATLAALIADVARARGAAIDRLFVVGLSAGGAMAVNLACTAPQLVAGVGVAAGVPYRCATDLAATTACLRGTAADGEAAAAVCRAAMGARARAVRATLWQGSADSVVSPVNLEALARMFAALNGATTVVDERRGPARHALYSDRGGRPVIETWLISGMGHAWSGGDPRGTHTYPPGPDATERMLDFLLG
jgi:poly(hydroxyalkanoate) depolymerase family esterase